MRNPRYAVTVVALALAAILLTLRPGSAWAVPKPASPALIEVLQTQNNSDLRTEVARKKYYYRKYYPRNGGKVWRGKPRHGPNYYAWRYNWRDHGRRYTSRRHGYNYFYGGFWYAYPWWALAGNYYDDDYDVNDGGDSDEHVQWCLNRYRSYDPETDTFMGYDGKRHYCNSPFD